MNTPIDNLAFSFAYAGILTYAENFHEGNLEVDYDHNGDRFVECGNPFHHRLQEVIEASKWFDKETGLPIKANTLEWALLSVCEWADENL